MAPDNIPDGPRGSSSLCDHLSRLSSAERVLATLQIADFSSSTQRQLVRDTFADIADHLGGATSRVTPPEAAAVLRGVRAAALSRIEVVSALCDLIEQAPCGLAGLSTHAAELARVSQQVAAALAAHECGAVAQGAREEAVAARADGGKERWALAVRPWCPHRPPAPALVLSGHAASLTPY